jgi:hypothetical protein
MNLLPLLKEIQKTLCLFVLFSSSSHDKSEMSLNSTVFYEQKI